MFILPLFLSSLTPLLIFGQARIFVWISSNQLSRTENWSGGEGPCDGDMARMGVEEAADQGIELAFLEGNLGISQLVLPENGILYFGKSAELGNRPAKWQCSKRAGGPQDVLFRPKIAATPNFFDSTNWRIKTDDDWGEEGLGFLDAERVPSNQDSIFFSAENVSKIGIEVPAKVRSFKLSGKSLSNEQLRKIFSSVEGQFTFRIGSRLGVDFQLDGRYQFRWPAESIFTIETENNGLEKEKQKAVFYGRPNSNLFEPQFSALCQFVHCEPVDKYCTKPIKPVGQCCEQCGAMMQFRQNSLNFTLSKQIIRQYANAAILWKMLPSNAALSFVRIDNNDFHPLYQLSVLGTSLSGFSESEFCSTMWSAFKKIQQKGVNAQLPIDFELAKDEQQEEYFGLEAKCSIKNGIRLGQIVRWLLFLSAIFAILAFAFRAEYRRNPRFRLFVANICGREMAAISNTVQFQASSEQVAIDRQETEVTDVDRVDSSAAGSFLEFVNRAFLLHPNLQTIPTAAGHRKETGIEEAEELLDAEENKNKNEIEDEDANLAKIQFEVENGKVETDEHKLI